MSIKRVLKGKIFMTLVVLVIIIVIGLVVVFDLLNGPRSVDLSSSTKSSSSALTYKIDLTPIRKSDSYVSFNYPKGMTLKTTDLVSQNSVDDYVFIAKDVYSWDLSIDISTVPEGQLSQSSSYKYRQENPAEYSQQTETVNGRSVVIMTDNNFGNGFSKVAYLVNGGQLATVSLLGDDSNGVGPLMTTFNMVLDSWQWQ